MEECMTALDGKVALVTGGSRGIGAGIARKLAADGADVAITYVSAKEKADAVVADIEAQGRRVLAIEADCADADAVVSAVEQNVAALGRIDVVVNNAGVFTAGPLEEITLEDVDRTLAINTRAAFVASQAAARRMRPGARIVNIGSNLGQRVPHPEVTLYAMSKAALNMVTRQLAALFVAGEGQQGDLSSPLDGQGQLALLLGGQAADTARHDFAPIG
jgi:3-oxoacyl-[acyl-carrier protein] reductase